MVIVCKYLENKNKLNSGLGKDHWNILMDFAAENDSTERKFFTLNSQEFLVVLWYQRKGTLGVSLSSKRGKENTIVKQLYHEIRQNVEIEMLDKFNWNVNACVWGVKNTFTIITKLKTQSLREN